VTNKDDQIWASDASGFATCSYAVSGNPFYYRGELSLEEQEFSSGHRELLAVRYSLEQYARSCKNHVNSTNIYWLTDSENLVSFLNKGSSKLHIQKEVFRVLTICKQLNIRIIPIHLLQDDPRIQIADHGSKIKDSDDWSVDRDTFSRLDEQFVFTIDLFASDKNSKCARFYSNFFCQGTHGIDAFCHNWNGEVAWTCPPIKNVQQTVRKIRSCTMSGVLMVPEWPTAEYWTELFTRDGKLRPPFIKAEKSRPYLLQGCYNPKSPFHGRAKFDFLELSYNSKFLTS
jgi:hypothetical protein